jgi:hypothetical protein
MVMPTRASPSWQSAALLVKKPTALTSKAVNWTRERPSVGIRAAIQNALLVEPSAEVKAVETLALKLARQV